MISPIVLVSLPLMIPAYVYVKLVVPLVKARKQVTRVAKFDLCLTRIT